MTYHKNPVVQILAKFVAAVAAANWTIVEFFGTDLMKDVLSLAGQNYKIAVAIVGVAAVLVVVESANELGDEM